MIENANKDDLTELYCRADWLKIAQAELHKDDVHKTLFYIDLDRFKFVNDSLGHDAGDIILKNAAQIIQSKVDSQADFVGRIGGDEFVALLTSPHSVAHARDIANSIIQDLCQPVLIDTTEVEIGASIGLAHYPNDSKTLDQLLKYADLAMYRAKHSGRNQMVSFHKLMIEKINYRRQIQAYLRRALKEESLTPVFEPIFDTRKQQLAAVELRVDCSQSKGLLGLEQEELFSIADESQVAIELGQWMFEQSVQFLTDMQGVKGDLEVITSVRPTHFQQNGFVDWLMQTVENAQVAPERLVLQFSDSALNTMRFPVQRRLQELSNQGLLIAVQNFGTGQLSPLKLHDWPIHQVHLSYAFVSEMTVKNSIASMTAALIQMGLMLNKRVVANGVGSLEQQAMLYSHQCYLMQGPLFGENLSAFELETMHIESLNDLGNFDNDYLNELDDY